uniref:Fe2OG dioxygenase domain-containing protein n=1 Tax=Kalanchoe fedtschenkoi TaxID=63787 RepID=A0A7N0ZW74_KALFE
MSDPSRFDPFLVKYQPSELRIASEFLTTWLPFLSKGLCSRCSLLLSRRVGSIQSPDSDTVVEATDGTNNEDSSDFNDTHDHDDNCDSYSLGSWNDDYPDVVNGASVRRLRNQSSASLRVSATEPAHETMETSGNHVSWADMAEEEDELGVEESKANNQLSNGNYSKAASGSLKHKPELSREQRERIRFNNVKRKKDFICLERVDGKVVNVLDGIELHLGIFSGAEQKRIVEYVYQLQEMGKKGLLRERTYCAPQKWMRGKGRVTIQFGCCYNYAKDKDGNPPGIIRNNLLVDPLPNLFKVIIKRLVRWHVLPTTCTPDSCIVNIYDEGDCIPPHIDNHDFLRPFCTVSFLSECEILFGSNLKIVGPGEFAGSFAIPLPVGSVLVLNGNGADVAKHCVPAVPTKRISITFRRMDESKRPVGFVPEQDLHAIQPLSYEVDRLEESSPQTPPPVPAVQTHRHPVGKSQPRSTMLWNRRGKNGGVRRYPARGSTHSEPRFSGQY